jgi:hypothetical protein
LAFFFFNFFLTGLNILCEHKRTWLHTKAQVTAKSNRRSQPPRGISKKLSLWVVIS